ncbi:transcriptional regulator [Corynebacterium phoceense]|uniref:transcriptional regulator n=1 Tax=Corynebacterium phoceense TaxID=1686286 RepID=UPI001D90F459|nr:transcriptional regulator [Corynebacterium phoceense]MCQ9333543.1 transcriptional regulator [Corynebacterium phoceense]MCQ9335324.1 transcriptional regulator [Corynebacterium phoceense]HJG43019.1 transcriptional regulator [Corynebacterium phoceense]
MINTIARYSFNEVDRAARDEFERDSLYKSFAVAFLVVQVMTIVTGAVLAWVLPGVHALWALAVFVPFVAGEIISSTWLKTQMPRPSVTRPWSFMIPLLIVELIMFVGLYVRLMQANSDYADGTVGGGFVGVAIAVLVVPVFRRWQHGRDQRRLDAQLED